ncbi:MAG: hypothetical protein WBW31_19365 [Candidatus Sulfotelmatobacter sp.]
MPNEQIKKRTMKEKATGELKKFAVLAVYLWVFLGVFGIHRALLLRGQVPGSELSFRTGFALVKALVLAKFMLLAETVWVVKTFKDKPLVYSILFKSAVYAAILVCMDILEEVTVGMFHGKPAAQSMTDFGGGGVEGIVLVGIIAFVILIPLFAFRGISDAIGQEELKSLLLKKRGTSTTV